MSNKTATFGVTIAGFGWWGQHMARRLADHSKITVRGVTETDAAKRQEIVAAGQKAFESLDEALARTDVDAVILTTPNLLHEEQVIQCAKAGKHVFCEKPLGLTAASARRSVAACKEAGVQLGIGHERRFETAMLALKSAIDQHDLGIIMHAEAAFSHDKLIHVPNGD
ncbi:MAG: Gfo/Idh/MocA family oxidoreductase, partial [Pseudomonadota bacterium]